MYTHISHRTARTATLAICFAYASGVWAQEPSAEPASQPTAEVPAAGESLPSSGAEGSEAAVPLTEAELAALHLDAAVAGVDKSIQLSGFMDFTAAFPIGDVGTVGLGVPRTQTFYVGNVNVYLGKRFSQDFRMLSEVRFTYLPSGSPKLDLTDPSYVSTEAFDYADNARLRRWGGIMLERVYLEWEPHRAVALRIGQFLTPYGIWNVDHGSPAYIPIVRPHSINAYFFPERQTGLELLGRWDPSNSSTIGYHLTLSNGEGPVSEYRDLDGNKAVGARLYWEHNAAGVLRVGASGYYGRDTSSVQRIVPMGDVVATSAEITKQFDTLSLAADIRYTLSGWLFQSEWVGRQRKYTDQGRAAHQSYFQGGRVFSSDSFSWAAYVLVAYRLPWHALTPYVMGQYSREIEGSNLVADFAVRFFELQAGLNFRPIDEIVVKCEFGRSKFYNKSLPTAVNLLQLQIAWAF